MIEKNVVVRNEEGLHTRPANQFVKLVKQFACEVVIGKNGAEAPGKSLLKIMKLGVVQGDSIVLRCDGPDEQDAMEALEEVLS